MIHCQVTIEPIEHRFASKERFPKTFEVCGFHRTNCEQKALDMYGSDYCRVANTVEFDPNYPPTYNHIEEDEQE